MASPLRVLVPNLTSQPGGAERSLLSFARRVDRERFALTLAVPEEGPLTEAFRRAGHDAFIDGTLEIDRRAPWASGIALLHRLRKEARARGIGLIHANGIWRINRAAALSLLTRIPAICHVRDVDPTMLASPKFRASCRVMKTLIAISDSVRTTLLAGGVPANKVERVYNGIDLDAFTPTPVSGWMRREWGIAEEAFLIGVVGQIEPRKGQLDFVRAARIVAEANPNARFVIIGGDLHGLYEEYRLEVEAEIARSGLVLKVVFAGILEEVADAMGALDLLVVPSSSEAFGRVAVEAMAASRPVVAYRVGGLAEIVLEDATGLTVAPGDVRSLAAVILRLASDPALASEMGRRGRARAEELFGVTTHVCALERIYERYRESAAA